MTQQMRKFEQEAIAKEILDTIKTNSSKEQQALEKNSKELKSIRKLNAKVESLHDQERELYRQRRLLVEEMGDDIQSFNNSLSSDTLFKLNKDYDDNISWSCNEWEIRQNIENKLAIALLSNDWQERLPEIISSIANQFTGE